MMMPAIKDQIFASICIILAGVLCWISFGYPEKASFFPRVLSVCMGLLGILFLVRISMKARRIKDTRKSGLSGTENMDKMRSAGLVFGSIFAYGFVVKLVNYELATFLFLAALIRYLGFRKKVATIFIAVGFTVLLHVIFFKLLGVARPESIFWQ